MARRKKEVTNTFYHWAREIINRPVEEEEILSIDRTEDFFQELFDMLQSGELINININAPPSTGKSITGMAIGKKLQEKHYKKPFGIKNIARDDQEFSKEMRNDRLRNCFMVIDEWNSLEKTGENSSVEQALYDYFSDVMAQRMINKISCSPKETTDKNALIQLDVYSVDKTTGINTCKLSYRMYEQEFNHTQLLGKVRIDVKPILQSKWYEEYRRRKFEKMDLILTHGIFRPRVLDYSHIIENVSKKLRTLTKQRNLITTDIIRSFIKQECRKNKIPQSIVGEELAVREVNAHLTPWKDYWSITKRLKQLEIMIMKQKDPKIKEEMILQKKEEMGMLDSIQELISMQSEELELYKKIDKKYNKVN